ncbi:MAG TPA: esterase-like activity of phytase family protein, partial [Candidatus Binatia bacterium]
CSVLSGQNHGTEQAAKTRPVELSRFDFDTKNPDRKQFGALTLMGAFQLNPKDRRFGGLSGLSIGTDGRLYAVSDRGYWLSARIMHSDDGAIENLVDWHIAPMLTPAKIPVAGSLVDAEAFSRDRDGSLLVAFEGRHRIWRYDPPPHTFASTPTAIAVPAELSRAPSNGGIEGLTALPDGRLLALTEEFANPDGSFKGWLLDGKQFAELSYLPAKGFRVTDCAALKNGDVLVLERRYVPFGVLSARVTIVDGKTVRPGGKLSGRELLRIEHPLTVENFEGLAVQESAKGTLIYLVSDDNYNRFQETLLLQFLLPDSHH